jgi:hypothetical protein
VLLTVMISTFFRIGSCPAIKPSFSDMIL